MIAVVLLGHTDGLQFDEATVVSRVGSLDLNR